MAKKTDETKEVKMLYAIHKILDDTNYWDLLDKTYKDVVHLEKHPFDLDVIWPDNNSVAQSNGILYLGHPGHTDISVKTMITYVRWFLATCIPSSDAKPGCLRVICVEFDENNRSLHDIYYEISSVYGILICGGCTDCSGGGKSGKETMDAIFTLLSNLYDVKIEEVRIPFEEGEKSRKKIEHVVDTRNMTTSEKALYEKVNKIV